MSGSTAKEEAPPLLAPLPAGEGKRYSRFLSARSILRRSSTPSGHARMTKLLVIFSLQGRGRRKGGPSPIVSLLYASTFHTVTLPIDDSISCSADKQSRIFGYPLCRTSNLLLSVFQQAVSRLSGRSPVCVGVSSVTRSRIRSLPAARNASRDDDPVNTPAVNVPAAFPAEISIG